MTLLSSSNGLVGARVSCTTITSRWLAYPYHRGRTARPRLRRRTALWWASLEWPHEQPECDHTVTI